MLAVFPFLAIARRELLSSLRRFRTFLYLAVFVGIVISITLMMWPEAAVSPMQFRQITQFIVLQISLGMALAAVVIMPGIGAASIVSEREQETIDQLHLTLIRPSGILGGKLTSTLSIYLLCLIAAFPVTASVLFAIGMDWGQVIASIALVTSAALTSANFGVLGSTVFRRQIFAIGAAYVLTLVWLFSSNLLQVVYAIVTGRFFMLSGMSGGGAAAVFSPFSALIQLNTGGSPGVFVVAAVLVQLLLCAIAFAISLRLLHRQTEPRAVSNVKPIDDEAVLARRKRRFPYYLIDPLRRKPAIEDGRNAMFVRELRWGLFNRATILVRIFYCVLIASFLSTFPALVSPNDLDSVHVWVGTEMIIFAFVVPAITANSFPKEFELGNIDMLRMTLLPPWSIVTGKSLACFASLGPVLWAVLVSVLPILYYQFNHLSLIIQGLVSIVVSVVFSLSLGMLISILSRRTPVAIFGGFLVNGLIYLALPPALALFEIVFGLTYSNHFEHVLETRYCALSPLWYFLYCVDGRDLHPGGWAFVQCMYLVVSAAILVFVGFYFHARRMQDA